MRKVVFWGAGKIGRNILGFWRKHGICPDYFADNDKELWGKEIDCVKIISPDEVFRLSEVTIYITCRFSDEIENQLLKKGIIKKNIIKANTTFSSEMIYEIADELIFDYKKNVKFYTNGCLIDLSKGMVLGGVEKWSYKLATVLKHINIEGAYLMPDHTKNTILDETFPVKLVCSEEEQIFDSYVKTIVYCGYKNIVCNFPHTILTAACIVKKRFLPDLHIIAVLHNDEEIYYNMYCLWSDYIDECLVISKKMKKELIQRGFPRERIRDLYWTIPCQKELIRSYSNSEAPIRIGFAGRLTKIQKRLDLIIDVAEKLKKHNVRFLLELAGTGDFENIIKQELEYRELTDNVILMGLIDNKNIAGFWEKQDIYLSCSDWEGHSISQSEAMAAGVVPVVTNTSGVEDDIEDGMNGYIVDRGDIETMVKRIEYLYDNRSLLSEMGRRCYEIIAERNKNVNEEIYWKELIK